MGASLSLHDVRHRRGRREVLRILSLEVPAGERLGLLGPNGAGKTSLLRLLAALEPPSAGVVTVAGLDTRRGGPELRRRIGLAPQRPVMLSMSALANVELALRYRGVGRVDRRATAREALERVGAGALAERAARMLSGGEAQRVSLARALAPDPELLLLDEPAAALDAPTRAAFLADLDQALGERSATVVHVSHRPEDLIALSDRLAVLVDGEIRQLGRPAAVLAAPADAAVARLVGYENVLAAEVAGDGAVTLAGRRTGLETTLPGGPATLAVWAAGVHCVEPEAADLTATITAAAAVAGRWDLRLDAGVALRAQAPLSTQGLEMGQRLGVSLDPTLLVLIAGAGESPGPEIEPERRDRLSAPAPPAR